MKLRKKKVIIILAVLFIFLLIALALFQLSKSRTFQFFGQIIPRIETEEKIVALIFDDGPTENTPEVLQILEETGVKATFYLIGNEMAKHPDISSQIVQSGPALGNHSYTHPRFYFKSQNTIHTEISETNKRIRQAGYTDEITFRPPTGKKLIGLPWYLSQNNIKTIMWDVEPDTYLDRSQPLADQTSFIVQHTIEKTKSGSIILMHPHCGNDCAADRLALPILISELKNRGYLFVTVPELLNR